jgi:hypothetical protein
MAACHAPEANCGPLSVVIAAGRPNLLNQPLVKVARQASVEVVTSRKASSHRVLRSTAVRR